MTIKDYLKQSSDKLAAAGIVSARLDAELLLAEACGQTRVWLLAHNDERLDQSTLKKANDLLEQRQQRMPMSYVLRRKQFYGLDFYVDQRVLTPRDETETIADEVIKSAGNGARVLDIGTGSGALAIAIKHHRPDLEVSASEVSDEALEVAQKNATQILGPNHGIELIKSDLFDKIVGRFDIIVTNLPYVSADYKMRMMAEVKYEPDMAIFGGSGDGLDLYRQFFAQVTKFLAPKGKVYLESDPWQQPELIKIAGQHGFEKIFQDYLSLGFVRETS